VTSKLLPPQNGEKHKNISSTIGPLIKICILDFQNKKQKYKSKELELPIAFPAVPLRDPHADAVTIYRTLATSGTTNSNNNAIWNLPSERAQLFVTTVTVKIDYLPEEQQNTFL
jgi:hypothetical protein